MNTDDEFYVIIDAIDGDRRRLPPEEWLHEDEMIWELLMLLDDLLWIVQGCHPNSTVELSEEPIECRGQKTFVSR
jgi:hypothetical protein